MKTITILSALFFSAKISAQMGIINLSLTDSSLGIIYTMIDNKIRIKTNIPDAKLSVAVNNGTISKINPYEFSWVVTDDKESVLTLMSANGKKMGHIV
jgi:hypothetical protein